MTATVFSEAQHPFDGLLEAHHQLSIDEVIVAASQTIVVGNLVGAIGVAADETAVTAYAAGNRRVLPRTVTIGSAAINGLYQGVFLTAGATAEFELQAPDGTVAGTAKIGTAFSGPIAFTFSETTPPAVGDIFTVAVTRPFDEAGEVFEAWSPTATDGSQVPAGIALQGVTTGAGATATIAVLRRDAAFRSIAVNWPTGLTAAQIAYATQQLAAKNIILR